MPEVVEALEARAWGPLPPAFLGVAAAVAVVEASSVVALLGAGVVVEGADLEVQILAEGCTSPVVAAGPSSLPAYLLLLLSSRNHTRSCKAFQLDSRC